MIDTSKIIIGTVGGGRYTVTAPIVKEDYGLYLKIEGLELPATYEVDFSNSEHNGTSVTMIGNADGVLIPRQFIETGKDVFAFLYHVGDNYGRTVFKFRIPNKCRPDRTNEEPTPEEQSVIDQAINALNDAVEQTSADVASADASAQSASDSADRAEIAEQDAESAANVAHEYADRAETSASQTELIAESIVSYTYATMSPNISCLHLNQDGLADANVTLRVEVRAFKGDDRLKVTRISGTPSIFYRQDGTDIPLISSRSRDTRYGYNAFIYNISEGMEIITETSEHEITITAEDAEGHSYAFTQFWSFVVVKDGEQGERGLTGAKGDKGDKGDTGERGTGMLKVTTAPTSYTTKIGGFSPKFRIALSTVQSQAYVDDVLVGDVISYSYSLYNVGYVDDAYAYLSAAISIRGAKGATGATGPAGSDASVTSANIESALGYVPESPTSVDSKINTLINRESNPGYVLTYDATVSQSKPYPWSWAAPNANISMLPITAGDSAGFYYVISQLKTAADSTGLASMSVPFDAGAAFLSNISAVYSSDKIPIISISGTSPNPIMRYLMINNLWADSTDLSGAEMGYWDGLYHVEIVIGTSTLTIIVEKKG